MPDPGYPDPGNPDPSNPGGGGGSGPGDPPANSGGHTQEQNHAAADSSRTRANGLLDGAACFTAVSGLASTPANRALASTSFARIYTAGGSGNLSSGGAATTWESAPGDNVLITFYGAFTDLPAGDQERFWIASYAGILGRTSDAAATAIARDCFGE